MDTSSYRELDKSWRDELHHLHDDYYYHRQVSKQRGKGDRAGDAAAGLGWAGEQALSLLWPCVRANTAAVPGLVFVPARSFLVKLKGSTAAAARHPPTLPPARPCAPQDALWAEHGHKTLPVLLGATDMLVCGEDLGMIPTCVHPTMQEMGIIGELGRAECCVSGVGRVGAREAGTCS